MQDYIWMSAGTIASTRSSFDVVLARRYLKRVISSPNMAGDGSVVTLVRTDVIRQCMMVSLNPGY